MDRAKRVVNEKNERILLEMTKQPGNDTCADCGAKGPRWASHNLGVFLCIRCGGLHRKMGTHISKIKSISLDSWTSEQIENMRQWGNLKANAKWNPHPEYHPVPVNASDSEMERYIRNKYERQSFRDRPEASNIYILTFLDEMKDYSINLSILLIINQSKQSSVSSPPTPPRRITNDSIIKYNNERGNYDNALRQLKDMGFTDNLRNREVLSTTNGDLSAAIEILCRLPSGSAPSASAPTTPTRSTIPNISSDDKLTQLWNMGFQDETKNRDALRRTGGNVEVAAALLLEARNTESLNNNNANSLKSNPSVRSQTSQAEQQQKQIKPVSQSSSQSFSNPLSLQQTSFQQTTIQNSSQNLFGSLSPSTGHYQQQPPPQPQQQQQNKFDKNAILSLYSVPQQSSTTSSNSFNPINNVQLGSANYGFGQQQNQAMSDNNVFGNKTSLGFTNETNGLNNGFGGMNAHSFRTGTNGDNLMSTTSNIPFNNNLFNVNLQQNSMSSNEIMANRQNSLSNFGNFGNTAPSTSLYSMNKNTPSLFASTNNMTSGYEFGQSQQRFTTPNSAIQQQITSPGFGLQQGVGSFSNGQSNELPLQQKTSFNTFMSNINQNQLNSNNNLYPNTTTSNANSGWHNINNLREYNR